VTRGEQYFWPIAGGGSLIAAQAAVIGLLLANRARRRRAERSLSERVSFEILLSGLSTAMAHLPPGEVRAEIDRGLRRIGEHLHLDRATLTEVSAEIGGCRLTHAWVGAGAAPIPIGFDRDRFPWVTDCIDRGEIVHVARLGDLPAAAAVDRSSFGERGIRSSVVVPLLAAGRVIGALAFSTVHREREWSPELLPRFRLIAGMFSNGLVRARGEAELQRLRSELAHMGRVTTSGELTASLAHELRQPLTAILSNAETAQELVAEVARGMVAPEGLEEILTDIVEDSKRAGEVICRLRSLLRKSEPERRPLEVNEVIWGVIRLVRSDAIIRHASVGLELAPKLPLVNADRVQVQQVMLNLIMNGLV
jgi:signal transduction histidine kinase